LRKNFNKKRRTQIPKKNQQNFHPSEFRHKNPHRISPTNCLSHGLLVPTLKMMTPKGPLDGTPSSTRRITLRDVLSADSQRWSDNMTIEELHASIAGRNDQGSFLATAILPPFLQSTDFLSTSLSHRSRVRVPRTREEQLANLTAVLDAALAIAGRNTNTPASSSTSAPRPSSNRKRRHRQSSSSRGDNHQDPSFPPTN
jgi:hypothetical protein